MRQAGMINRLRKEKDSLIKKFSKKELQPILDNNKYHSQEENQTDPDNPSGARRIVIKDPVWRSLTVS